MTVSTLFDIRQSITHDDLDQIASVSGKSVDEILRLINEEIALPLCMQQTTIPSLVVNVGPIMATNSSTGRSRTIPPIAGVLPDFTGGYITFPATTGGLVECSTVGSSSTLLLCPTGYHAKVVVYIDGQGILNVIVGAAALIGVMATFPAGLGDVFNIGYIEVSNTSGTIDMIDGSMIHQFEGDAGSSAGVIGPILYTLTPQPIGDVGSVGQIRAGHVLTDNSFPAAATGKTRWSLATALSSVGALGSMTNVGGSFIGTDLWGATFNALTSGYAYINTNRVTNIGQWSYGGWFKRTDWNSAVVEGLMGEGIQATTTPYWQLSTSASTVTLTFRQPLSSLGAAQNNIQVTTKLDSAVWHHFAVTIDNHAVTGNENFGQVRVYVDGILAISETIRGVWPSPAGLETRFYVGSAPAYLATAHTMTVREVYHTPTLIAADYIKRSMAAKIFHEAQIPGEQQLWIGLYQNADGGLQEPITNDWMVDKSSPDDIYVNFRQFDATDMVALKLIDLGTTGSNVVTPKTFDTGWLSSVPTFPMNHNLPDVPSTVALLFESTPGDFTTKSPDGYLTWNSSQFTGSMIALAALGISATRRIRIVATYGAAAINAQYQVATPIRAGAMSISEQHMAGDKYWAGDLMPEVDGGSNLGSALQGWGDAYVSTLHVAAIDGITLGGGGLDVWDNTKTYDVYGEVVRSIDGLIFYAVTAISLGSDPATSPLVWRPVTQNGVTAVPADGLSIADVDCQLGATTYTTAAVGTAKYIHVNHIRDGMSITVIVGNGASGTTVTFTGYDEMDTPLTTKIPAYTTTTMTTAVSVYNVIRIGGRLIVTSLHGLT